MKKAWIVGALMALSLNAFASDAAQKQIPCPFGWSVQPNPSADNSLSYLTIDGSLAVSVTSIRPVSGQVIESASYARVASQQMQCDLPVKSNLIADAWSFECKNDGIEAVVYGNEEELVLLAISGRNANNEAQLEDFVRFLAYQAKNR